MNTPDETLANKFKTSLEVWMEHKTTCFECNKNRARTSCQVGDELLEQISQLQRQIAGEARKSA